MKWWLTAGTKRPRLTRDLWLTIQDEDKVLLMDTKFLREWTRQVEQVPILTRAYGFQ